MVAQFKVAVDQPQWRKMINEIKFPIASAAVQALRETASNTVDEGRQNIASSGRFGRNWQRDLQFRMRDEEINGEPSLEAKAIVFHKSGLAGVFESGITISARSGKLLWIPTRRGLSSPGVEARRRGLKLTSATVHGTPMLFNAADPDPRRKPLYIGVPSVRIGKKWRIIEIAKENVAKIGILFAKFFRGD
jgi:hypothetical protein